MRNIRLAQAIVIGLLLPFVLCACAKKSRIPDSAFIDVCGLVPASENERVAGSAAAAAPVPMARTPGFAGGCTWSVNRGDGISKVSANVMTRSSAAELATTPTRWLEDPVRVADAKANFGEAAQIGHVGDVAMLYGSALSVRQGDTVLLLHGDHGDADLLVEMARTLLSPKGN